MVDASVDRPRAANAAAISSEMAIVAVTYNSFDVITQFLQALPAALDGVSSCRVIVVDNGSQDRTVEIVRTIAPWVEVVDVGHNVGYAGGINLGLARVSPTEGVMVLNPDTIPRQGSLRCLVNTARADIRVGIAVPKIVDLEGRLSYSLRREPTIMRALGEAILGGRVAGRIPLLGETIRGSKHYVEGARADWATGAAMFLSRRALDAAGLWSEDFFLYSEETDYALRVRDAGLQLRLVADAEVVHVGGELSRSPWLWSLKAVNRTRLYGRRHGPMASAVYWCAVVLNEAIRSVSGARTHRAALRALFVGHEQLREGWA